MSSMMKRRAAVVGVVALTLGAVLAASAGADAASAAQDDVLLSLDGVIFAPTLSGGLFDGVGTLVPGDEEQSTLWVKNNTQLDGALWLSRVDAVGTATLFTRALTLYETGTSPAEAGPAGAGGASCTLLSQPRPIRAGEAIAIPLTLSVADLDGRDGQNERVTLQVIAALADAAGPSPGNTYCPLDGASVTVSPSPGAAAGAAAGHVDPLPFTGVVPAPWIIAGGLLLGAGLFFAVARRRERNRP